MTSGIVSARGRTVQVPGDNDASALLADAIQTDAAINPGNSGGALVAAVAMWSVYPPPAPPCRPSGQSSAGSIGIGFAIPVDLAKLVSNEIINTGTVYSGPRASGRSDPGIGGPAGRRHRGPLREPGYQRRACR